jgi:hypothetical protein
MQVRDAAFGFIPDGFHYAPREFLLRMASVDGNPVSAYLVNAENCCAAPGDEVMGSGDEPGGPTRLVPSTMEVVRLPGAGVPFELFVREMRRIMQAETPGMMPATFSEDETVIAGKRWREFEFFTDPGHGLPSMKSVMLMRPAGDTIEMVDWTSSADEAPWLVDDMHRTVAHLHWDYLPTAEEIQRQGRDAAPAAPDAPSITT